MIYFERVRDEIEPLLPTAPKRILEIGSAAGGTLAWLKKKWPDCETVAIEGQHDLLPALQAVVDHAIIADLEEPLPADLGKFDLILALDVLEHLRSPTDVLHKLASLLNHSGSIIVSVPNVANFRVLGPLVFKRQFRYADAGILDRTHMRFFTEESALEMMREAGLTVVDGLVNGLTKKRSKLIDVLTLGQARHYLAEQYVMRGELTGGGPFKWRW